MICLLLLFQTHMLDTAHLKITRNNAMCSPLLLLNSISVSLRPEILPGLFQVRCSELAVSNDDLSYSTCTLISSTTLSMYAPAPTSDLCVPAPKTANASQTGFSSTYGPCQPSPNPIHVVESLKSHSSMYMCSPFLKTKCQVLEKHSFTENVSACLNFAERCLCPKWQTKVG